MSRRVLCRYRVFHPRVGRDTMRVALYEGQGSVELIDTMGTDATPVSSARVSTSREHVTGTDDARDARLVAYLAKHEHLSPFEHIAATVRIVCPLFIARQVMRHRTFSFNEISRRYTEEDVTCWRPHALRAQSETRLQCSGDGEVDDAHELLEAYDASMRDALKLYHHMIERGVARELARAVLPQSMMTTFWMSGSLRNWAHFIRLRADAHAQPEAIELAVAIREILRDAFPRSVAALIGGVDE